MKCWKSLHRNVRFSDNVASMMALLTFHTQLRKREGERESRRRDLIKCFIMREQKRMCRQWRDLGSVSLYCIIHSQFLILLTCSHWEIIFNSFIKISIIFFMVWIWKMETWKLSWSQLIYIITNWFRSRPISFYIFY